MRHVLSPLRGSAIFSAVYPRLAPWAAFFRRFAAPLIAPLIILTGPQGSMAVTDVTAAIFPSQSGPKWSSHVFLNCPLQFFAFIWYKQFTESKVWQSGIFV